MYAMYLPFGDQLALRSWFPELLVKFRVIPFFRGTVKTSPRATYTALFPSGPMSQDCMLSFTDLMRLRPTEKSSFIWMLSFSALSVCVFSL